MLLNAAALCNKTLAQLNAFWQQTSVNAKWRDNDYAD
jgi:hypothetical protein